ncbi:hypothetical protein W97_09113 [Coniosporium apollinis CBS 100218]|uniref:Phosphatidylinositol-specific phospholipase C X domain-containing protein n=1 Tax=Coniosporium apollinis (strain CBS 100218) TaxID=1168221 RepID=R7Z6N1_CONA1|nr:uncharacterized protein W97_09113 [Coniosporium apollinis CBS 100218]EON69850.1 hypothetical protein W97_09113 [Coniosporium apollinis CBS 100218]
MFFSTFTIHLATLAVFTSWTGISAQATQRTCNNSPDLCDRPFDSIVHLGTHNSPFVRDASTGWSSFGNQLYNTTVQLDAGVRLLSAQVHARLMPDGTREFHLCHTICELSDAGRLSDWLYTIRIWLDQHPDDVVTIVLVNSDQATAADLAGEYTLSGASACSYIPPSPEAPDQWPTLNTLIDAGTRMLTFIAYLPQDDSRAQAPYLMDEFAHVFENPYDTSTPTNFTCTPDRPGDIQGNVSAAIASKKLFLQNHFLYWNQLGGIQVPDIRHIGSTNAPEGPGGLGARLISCMEVYGASATFVLVDFFNVGPAVSTVDMFNGVAAPVGRLDVTTKMPPQVTDQLDPALDPSVDPSLDPSSDPRLGMIVRQSNGAGSSAVRCVCFGFVVPILVALLQGSGADRTWFLLPFPVAALAWLGGWV